MTRNRYKDATRLLGGKYRPGVPAARAARVLGSLDDVEYEFTWNWKTYEYSAGRRKKNTERVREMYHEYRFDCTWHPEPMILAVDDGIISTTASTPGTNPELDSDQLNIVGAAFGRWPGIRITNHGYEWTMKESDETAQELAVTVQGLSASLQSLVPPKPALGSRLTPRLRFPRKTAPDNPADDESAAND